MPIIAGYELHAIETGRFALDGGAMFGVVPKVLWQRKAQPDDRNRIPLSMRSLLLVGNGRVVLVDNGAGHKYDEKFADIYAIDHERHTLARSLDAVGFSPDDVTDVILTHLHFDHCGGTTRMQDGGPVLTFRRAVHHVQRAHWEWARDPNPRERASFLKDNLQPMADSGQLHLSDGAETILPGVEVIVVNGHTMGQQLVRVFDENRSLLFLGDLIPTAAHLPIPWVMGYDVQPLETLREKEVILEEASEAQWELFFEHDPEIETGQVIRNERGYELTNTGPLAEL